MFRAIFSCSPLVEKPVANSAILSRRFQMLTYWLGLEGKSRNRLGKIVNLSCCLQKSTDMTTLSETVCLLSRKRVRTFDLKWASNKIRILKAKILLFTAKWNKEQNETIGAANSFTVGCGWHIGRFVYVSMSTDSDGDYGLWKSYSILSSAQWVSETYSSIRPSEGWPLLGRVRRSRMGRSGGFESHQLKLTKLSNN